MNKNQKYQVASYFVSFFSFGLIVSILGIALPYLADHGKVSLGDAALLFTMNSVGFLFGSLISGYLYDILKGKYLLSIAWFVASAATYFLPIVSSFSLMCLINIFFGFANSAIVVGCNTLITRVDDRRTTHLLSTMHVVNGIGAFVTPVLFTILISKTNDVIFSYHIYSVYFLLLSILVLFTPNHRMERKQAHVDDKSISKSNNNVLLITLLAFIAFVYVGSEISFNGWLYTFMKVKFPAFGGNAGYVSAAFWLFMTFGRLTFTYIGKYYKVRNLMLITLLGSIIGLSLIALFNSYFYIVWIGTAFTGFFMGSVFPFIVSFGDNSIGLSGKVSGIVFSGTSFGGMLMPYLNGQIFEKVSPQGTMFSIMCTMILTFIIFSILYKKAPHNERELRSIIPRSVYDTPLIKGADK